jgi:hypothetical protein
MKVTFISVTREPYHRPGMEQPLIQPIQQIVRAAPAQVTSQVTERPQIPPAGAAFFPANCLPAPYCASMADGHFNEQRKDARRMQAPH